MAGEFEVDLVEGATAWVRGDKNPKKEVVAVALEDSADDVADEVACRGEDLDPCVVADVNGLGDMVFELE